MADVTWRVVFRRVAAGLHLALGKDGAGILVGGEVITATVFDNNNNERCSVTYNMSNEAGFHFGVNFAGAEATFQHDENDECPFQLGDSLKFRSWGIIFDRLSVEFTHKGSTVEASTDLGISAAFGFTSIDATAESGTTDDDQVVIFGPGLGTP